MPRKETPPERFEDWLNKEALSDDGVSVDDLDHIELLILMRLRSVFTEEQVALRAIHLLETLHTWISTPDLLQDEDGNKLEVTLAENFQGTQQEMWAMMTADSVKVSDESLQELLQEEE